MRETLGPSNGTQEWLGINPMQIHSELFDALDNSTTRNFVKKAKIQAAFMLAGQAASLATTGATMLMGYEVGDKLPATAAHDPLTAGIMASGYALNWATNIKGAKVEAELAEDKNLGVSTNLLLTSVNKAAKVIAPSFVHTRIALTAGTGLVWSGLTELETWRHVYTIPSGWTILTSKEYGAALGGLGWIVVRNAIKRQFGEKKDVEQPTEVQHLTADETIINTQTPKTRSSMQIYP